MTDRIDEAFDQLVDDIKGAIRADVASTGFHSINCPMCKNKNEIKKTGGFKFEPDTIGYNCFKGSCTAPCVYTKGEYIPKKFRALMDTLGVDIPIELKAVNNKKRKKLFEVADERFEKNIYTDCQMPDFFDPEISDFWVNKLVERNVIYDLDYRQPTQGSYKNCLVVPYYFYDKLIGWDYLTADGKYLASQESNENMIFVPSAYIPDTVFLVEGVFDALCFPNTVATRHAKISPKQAYHLRNKRVIVLPDRSGSKLYESAKYYEWEICLPMWKEKDLSSSVERRGILATAKMMHDGIMQIGGRSDILYKRWTGKE